MILCFGTFASILSCCTQGLPHFKFVPKIAWVVDRRNSSLAIRSGDDDDDDDVVVDDPDVMEGNPQVVSRLLSCERPLVLNDKQLPSLDVACERFKSKVMPHISADMVAKAVLAVRYIISLDDTTGNERKETFKKYLGMYRDELLQQTIFDVPDFFARVLLYTTCVNNKEGIPYAKEITDAFIKRAANDNQAELKWDSVAQTLELIPTGDKLLSDWVNRLCELRSPITEDEEGFANMEWIGVNMTDLDPSIYGHARLKDSDAQRLLSRKINPYARITSPECLVNSLSPIPRRVFRARSDKKPEDM